MKKEGCARDGTCGSRTNLALETGMVVGSNRRSAVRQARVADGFVEERQPNSD